MSELAKALKPKREFTICLRMTSFQTFLYKRFISYMAGKKSPLFLCFQVCHRCIGVVSVVSLYNCVYYCVYALSYCYYHINTTNILILLLSSSMHIHLYTYTPIHLYTYTPIHLHTYTPIHLHTYTPIHLHTYTPIHLYTYTPIHLCTSQGLSRVWNHPCCTVCIMY
jgi:hypothetical protein